MISNLVVNPGPHSAREKTAMSASRLFTHFRRERLTILELRQHAPLSIERSRLVE